MSLNGEPVNSYKYLEVTLTSDLTTSEISQQSLGGLLACYTDSSTSDQVQHKHGIIRIINSPIDQPHSIVPCKIVIFVRTPPTFLLLKLGRDIETWAPYQGVWLKET